MSDLSTVVNLLEGLGFLINNQKSVLQPTQSIDFLGYTINSVTMTLFLPKEKVLKIVNSCRELLKADKVSARDLAQVIGQLTATNEAVLPGSFHYRSLKILKTRALHTGGHYNHRVSLGQEAKIELLWWVSKLEQWNGKTLVHPNPYITIQSDASLSEWWATSQGVNIGGFWIGEEKLLHINQLELKTAFLALHAFSKGLMNKHILLQLDNKKAMAYIKDTRGEVSDCDSDSHMAVTTLVSDTASVINRSPRVVTNEPQKPFCI
jgi:hypothetical protein